MEELYFLFTTKLYVLYLLLFLIASIIFAIKEPKAINFSLLTGFILVFIGYCLQNYTHQEVIYDTNRNATITYSWLFTVGSIASALGLLIASASFLVKGIKLNA